MSESHSIPADREKAWEESDNLVLKQNYASIQEASVDDFGIPVPAVMEKIIDRFSPEDPYCEAQVGGMECGRPVKKWAHQCEKHDPEGVYRRARKESEHE